MSSINVWRESDALDKTALAVCGLAAVAAFVAARVAGLWVAPLLTLALCLYQWDRMKWWALAVRPSTVYSSTEFTIHVDDVADAYEKAKAFQELRWRGDGR